MEKPEQDLQSSNKKPATTQLAYDGYLYTYKVKHTIICNLVLFYLF